MARITIRKIGSSRGIIIPDAVLARLGLEDEVELSLEGNAIVLRKLRRRIREGWAAASKVIGAGSNGLLAWPKFANVTDSELTW